MILKGTVLVVYEQIMKKYTTYTVIKLIIKLQKCINTQNLFVWWANCACWNVKWKQVLFQKQPGFPIVARTGAGYARSYTAAERECARVQHEPRFIQTKLCCYTSLSAGKFPSVTWQRRAIQPWQLRAKGTITWWDEGLRNFLGHRVLALSVRPAGNADCVNVLFSPFKTFLRHHLCQSEKISPNRSLQLEWCFLKL